MDDLTGQNGEIVQHRDEATAWMQANDAPMGMRSCWDCNGAHEHLRDAEYPFWCFDCGHYFYKGVDITEFDDEPIDGSDHD